MANAGQQQAIPFANYQYEIYLQGMAGVRPDHPVGWGDLEAAAEQALAPEPRGYLFGGASTEDTMRANLEAFRRRRIVPRMLEDDSERDLSRTVLGTPRPAPVLLAPVGGELGERESDECAVVRRRHAHVAGLDGLLDRLDGALVVCGDHVDARLGHREARELLERHFRAVVVDPQLLDDRRRRASGADAGELLLHVEDSLAHLVLGFLDLRVHQRSSPAEALTSVPIASPTSARMMLPGWVTSNTMIGSELSMQNVIAVESITCRPRCSTSK